MDWNILACGTKTVCASTSFMLAYFYARLLKATYISFPRTRISTPNNVRSIKKIYISKNTNSCMHSKALPSFAEVHNVFTSKPTYAFSDGTRTNITTHEAGSYIHDLAQEKVHMRTTLYIQISLS